MPKRRAGLVATFVAFGIAGGGLAVAAPVLSDTAHPRVDLTGQTQATSNNQPGRKIQKNLDALTANTFPGAMAVYRDREGNVTDYTSGVGDLATGEEVPANGRFRIASNTKTFTAAVVLLLVEEGRIDLDARIEKYLPGVIRGPGGDGRKITVRQLLRQQTGLPNYTDQIVGDYAEVQHRYFENRELLDAALAQKRLFEPGRAWGYSNTNYIVAALLVQQVTGRPIGEEITERVIRPLGLRDTSWPNTGDQNIEGPHAHNYYWTPDAPEKIDTTVNDPSMAGAAGALISTPRDLMTFFTRLMAGDLLRPAELEEMKKGVDAPEFDAVGRHRYGLGLAKTTLSCGQEIWTHGGDYVGNESRGGVTEDGRAVFVVVTGAPQSLDDVKQVVQTVDDALCAS